MARPQCKMPRVNAALQAAEKGPHSFCHSERSEESLFLFMGLNRREIPRFARNDKINYFFRSLFSRWPVRNCVAAQTLKRVLPETRRRYCCQPPPRAL